MARSSASASQPSISVPAITLEGARDGVVPVTDGRSTAARFTGRRTHRIIPGVRHNLPQKAPQAFANAVVERADV
jgi:pimeloyl-ACP methyl ester carboxylesterase